MKKSGEPTNSNPNPLVKAPSRLILEPLISELDTSKPSRQSFNLEKLHKLQLEAAFFINSAANSLSILAENYLEKSQYSSEEFERIKFGSFAAHFFTKTAYLTQSESILLAYADQHIHSKSAEGVSRKYLCYALILFERSARTDAVYKIKKELGDSFNNPQELPNLISPKTTLTSPLAYLKLKKQTISQCNNAVTALSTIGSILSCGVEYDTSLPWDRIPTAKMYMIAAAVARVEAEMHANIKEYKEAAAAFVRCNSLYQILLKIFPKADFCYQRDHYLSDAYVRYDVLVKSAASYLKTSSTSATDCNLSIAYYLEAGDAIIDLLKLGTFENIDGNRVVIDLGLLIQNGINAYRAAIDLLYNIKAENTRTQPVIEKLVYLSSFI